MEKNENEEGKVMDLILIIFLLPSLPLSPGSDYLVTRSCSEEEEEEEEKEKEKRF